MSDFKVQGFENGIGRDCDSTEETTDIQQPAARR